MDLIDLIYMIFSFIFGACIGSFLNVLIYRLPNKMSIVSPPSHCTSCNALIKWYDNIPIFSYLFLRGRCRNCKAHFSARYCLIEAFTAVMYVLTYLRFRQSIITIIMMIVISMLIVIFFIDLKHFIIPDSMIIVILLCGVASFFFKNDALNISTLDRFLSIGLVALIFSVIFLAEKLFKKELMGYGDIKLFFVMGLLLGIKLLFLAIFVSAVIALIVEVIFNKNKRKVIPFGPYLAVGFTLMIFFGSDIIRFYASLF